MQHERWALIFVDHAHPAGLAENHLKAHAMVMHIVGHLATVGDTDMRGDEATAEPPRDQIAVMHAGTANVPCRVFLTVSDEECLLCGCNLQCRLGIDQLDANATWADKLRLGRVGKYRTIARQLDTDAVLRWPRRTLCAQAQVHAVAR